MRTLKTSMAFMAIALAPASLLADTGFLNLPLKDRLALSLSVGTTGIGPELQYKATDRLVLRTGYNFLRYDTDDDIDDIDYEAELRASTFHIAADYHPFKNSFFLSGGAYIGGKSVNLDGNVNEPVEIGDQTFTPAEVGTLTGEVDLRTVAPFTGLGYNNAFSGSPFAVKVMAGVIFTGSPEATLSSRGGTLSSDPTLQAELNQEEQNLEDDLEDFQFYPLLSLGFGYRF